MKNEHTIVNELRHAEKLGLLRSNLQISLDNDNKYKKENNIDKKKIRDKCI